MTHTIEHADGVVLVDTGMLDSTPELDEEGAPVSMPENIPRDVVRIINTHLHFDHCGGNRLFPGVPIHVQRLELPGPHDPHEWVDFPGATYVEHDGEADVLPGIRLLPTPGHTNGHQSVPVDTPDGLVVIGGDVAYTYDEAGGRKLGQGTLVPVVARALAIPMRERPVLPWELSVRLGEEPPAAHEFEVSTGSRAAGHAIRDLPLGERAWVTLVVREGAATRPGGSLELRAGDRVLLLAEADDLEPLARIFAGASG